MHTNWYAYERMTSGRQLLLHPLDILSTKLCALDSPMLQRRFKRCWAMFSVTYYIVLCLFIQTIYLFSPENLEEPVKHVRTVQQVSEHQCTNFLSKRRNFSSTQHLWSPWDLSSSRGRWGRTPPRCRWWQTYRLHRVINNSSASLDYGCSFNPAHLHQTPVPLDTWCWGGVYSFKGAVLHSPGVGAVLSQRSTTDQKLHPCAFFSGRKLWRGESGVAGHRPHSPGMETLAGGSCSSFPCLDQPPQPNLSLLCQVAKLMPATLGIVPGTFPVHPHLPSSIQEHRTPPVHGCSGKVGHPALHQGGAMHSPSP